jgi:hypothetical protein
LGFNQSKWGRRIFGEQSNDIHGENKMKENTKRMLIKQTQSCHLAGSLAEPEHKSKRMINRETGADVPAFWIS